MDDTLTALRAGTLSNSRALAELRTRRAVFATDGDLHPHLHVRGLAVFDTALQREIPAAQAHQRPFAEVLLQVLTEIGGLYVEAEKGVAEWGSGPEGRDENGGCEKVEGEEVGMTDLEDVFALGIADGLNEMDEQGGGEQSPRITRLSAAREVPEVPRRSTRERRATTFFTERNIGRSFTNLGNESAKKIRARDCSPTKDYDAADTKVYHSSPAGQLIFSSKVSPNNSTSELHDATIAAPMIHNAPLQKGKRAALPPPPRRRGKKRQATHAVADSEQRRSLIVILPLSRALQRDISANTKKRLKKERQSIRLSSREVKMAAPVSSHQDSDANDDSGISMRDAPSPHHRTKRLKGASTRCSTLHSGNHKSPNSTALATMNSSRPLTSADWNDVFLGPTSISSTAVSPNTPTSRSTIRCFHASSSSSVPPSPARSARAAGKLTSTQATKKPNPNNPSLSRPSTTSPLFTFPSLPPLPSAHTAPFLLGASIALENLLEDHAAHPSLSLEALMQDLEGSRPNVAGKELVVLSGGAWVVQVLRAMARAGEKGKGRVGGKGGGRMVRAVKGEGIVGLLEAFVGYVKVLKGEDGYLGGK